MVKTGNTVVKAMIEAIVLPMANRCMKCGKKNHFKSVCKNNDKCDQSCSRPKKGKGGKGKKFHEINESDNKDNSMDDLADHVQSLILS